MIEWRQCTEEDLDEICPYEKDMILVETLKRDLTHAVVMCVDGEPIGAGGVVVQYEGVGQAWTMLSERIVQHHPMAMTRFARRWLDALQMESGIVRVYGMCLNAETPLNWMVSLGFRPEGLMLNMGIGGKGDFWMCGRIR